jgi:hypothetical protein
MKRERNIPDEKRVLLLSLSVDRIMNLREKRIKILEYIFRHTHCSKVALPGRLEC